MSDFEFLDRVTIGQYIPGISLLHRMDPRARLLVALLLLGAATFAPHPAGLGVALLVVMTAITLSGLPWNFLLRGLVPPLPFLIFLALRTMSAISSGCNSCGILNASFKGAVM